VNLMSDHYKGYRRIKSKPGCKDAIEFETYGSQAYQVICDLLPYMDIKQTRMTLAKILYESKQILGKKLPAGYTEAIYQKAKELNKRGA